ncbi:MAG: phosphotransferase [Glaciecola sp.]
MTHQRQLVLSNDIINLIEEYQWLNLHSDAFTIKQIDPEKVNDNFKLDDGTHRLLLKFFNMNTRLLISRRDIFLFQQQLHDIGLAPRPLFLSEDSSVYIEQWLDTLPTGDAQTHKLLGINQQHISLLADALYNIHNAFITAPNLSLADHWHVYRQQVSNGNTTLIKRYNELQPQLVEYVAVNKVDFVMCHNDLHLDHICPQTGKVIDWEYASIGCRYIDISNCILINQLSSAQAIALCNEYATIANQNADELLQRVQNVAKFSELTFALWADSVGFEINKQ